MPAAFVERRGDELRVRVRLTPGARKDGFGGLFTDADGKAWLKASVRAAPEKGRANEALIGELAKRAGVPRGRIALVSGDTARTKTLAVAACTKQEEAALAALAEG